MRSEEPLGWVRRRGENLREGRAALTSERAAGRYEAVGSDPGWITTRLMRGHGPVRPFTGGGSAIGVLDGGIDLRPGIAKRWFDACVALMIEGFLLWGVGWVLDRFLGFGAGLMLFGSLMCTVALLGMLLVPVVWAADLAVRGIRQSRARSDRTA